MAEHVEACAACQEKLEGLTRAPELGPLRSVAAAAADELFLRRLQSPISTPTEVVSPSPSMTSLPQVPGYEVFGELGRGGMGIVYKARQVALNRLVALKMILRGRLADASAVQRFHREAEAVARLTHPNIVQIYEVGNCEELPYFTLELVDGISLARHLRRGPLPADSAAVLVAVLAGAVAHAHQLGVIHRDLMPSNILLQRIYPQMTQMTQMKEEEDGQPPRRPQNQAVVDSSFLLSSSVLSVSSVDHFFPKIADFGLAKRIDEANQEATPSGDLVGTPSYMAPEQAAGRGQTVGPAADIYALGAILYECLTRRPPFHAATPMETVLQVVVGEVVAPRRLQPSVPRDLETICLKCLQKEPGRRYASALALAEDLRRFRAGEAITARRSGALGRAWR
jgi:serine/threonine protein kinase